MQGKRVLNWLGSNAEALIALLIAVVAGVLGIMGVAPAQLIDAATLLTIAALALALLRDRWRTDAEPRAREALMKAESALHEFPSHVSRINTLESVIGDTRIALGEASMVRILVGQEIDRALSETRSNAREWHFKGGTATFVRAVVIPECVRNARRNRRVLSMRLEVLDPRNEKLCERYANYFRRIVDDPNEDEQSWTGEGTQLEIFATILAACWWKQRYPPLEIHVALSAHMSIFRWDMTQDCLIVTERGPRFPAMMFKEGRFYYDYWRNELRESFAQAFPLALHLAPQLSDEPTVEETRELFSRLGVDLPDAYSDEHVGEVIKQAIRAANPYA